jgi:exosome complex component RRP4
MADERAAIKRIRTAGPHVVTPGDVITSESGFIRGHGTLMIGEALSSSIAGVVERVNKVISVKPVRARFGCRLP